MCVCARACAFVRACVCARACMCMCVCVRARATPLLGNLWQPKTLLLPHMKLTGDKEVEEEELLAVCVDGWGGVGWDGVGGGGGG